MAVIHFFPFLPFTPQNDGVPALVTLKKGLVALARQWMKFIVVTQGFKAIGLMRPNQLSKPKEPQQSLGETILGLDNGAALQSDTSADGAEFEFDAGGNSLLSASCYFYDIVFNGPICSNRWSVKLLTSAFARKLTGRYHLLEAEMNGRV